METAIPSIKNVHVSAIEENGNLTFMHKIKNGAVDKSYGIHVAKLAGLPEEIIKNATTILEMYERKGKKEKKEKQIQFVMDFKEEKEDALYEKIRNTDPLRMTPMDAMNFVYELKENVLQKQK